MILQIATFNLSISVLLICDQDYIIDPIFLIEHI